MLISLQSFHSFVFNSPFLFARTMKEIIPVLPTPIAVHWQHGNIKQPNPGPWWPLLGTNSMLISLQSFHSFVFNSPFLFARTMKEIIPVLPTPIAVHWQHGNIKQPIPDPGGRFWVLIPCQSHFNPFRVSCSTARFYVSTGKIPNVYLGARLYQRCQTQQISHAC